MGVIILGKLYNDGYRGGFIKGFRIGYKDVSVDCDDYISIFEQKVQEIKSQFSVKDDYSEGFECGFSDGLKDGYFARKEGKQIGDKKLVSYSLSRCSSSDFGTLMGDI